MTHAWGGPIDVSPTHLPIFGSRGRVHHGFGFTGNGVGPAYLGGEILARLALDLRDELTRLALVDPGRKLMPPEPVRWLGGSLIRSALVRRDAAEDAGADPTWSAFRGGPAAPARSPAAAVSLRAILQRDPVRRVLRHGRHGAVGQIGVDDRQRAEEVEVTGPQPAASRRSPPSPRWRRRWASGVVARSARPAPTRSSRTCSTTPWACAVRAPGSAERRDPCRRKRCTSSRPTPIRRRRPTTRSTPTSGSRAASSARAPEIESASSRRDGGGPEIAPSTSSSPPRRHLSEPLPVSGDVALAVDDERSPLLPRRRGHARRRGPIPVARPTGRRRPPGRGGREPTSSRPASSAKRDVRAAAVERD